MLRLAAAVLCVGVLAHMMGCAAPPRQTYQPHRYTIDLKLQPAEHGIVASAAIDLARVGPAASAKGGPVEFELALHPDLHVTSVRASGVNVLSHATMQAGSSAASASDPDEPPGPPPRTHRIVIDRAAEAMTLFVEYEGRLFQDVSAGEKPGEIHNFAMSAHVDAAGIYLAGGNWYPEPVLPDDAQARGIDFVVAADKPDGIELIASGELDTAALERTGRYRWRSPFPLDHFVLVGGPLKAHRDRHRNIDISVYLSDAHAAEAPGLVAAVKRYLDRYEPLIGPYPAAQYAVVENFFSSGFAFPMFTLLSADVIAMGERARTTHGYLDHEMLHSWWGNGVFVDPADGNWCESLASYAANYYGFVLDGDAEGARRTRRNYAHFLSSVKPENDKPLGTYGQKDGCARGIAYSKGAMVFHMLARRMGQEKFWSAMRTMTGEYVGRYASWKDIQRLCEEACGEPLDGFFQQWVRRSGAPAPSMASAEYDAATQTLVLDIDRGDNDFALELPVAVRTGGEWEDASCRLAAGAGPTKVRIPMAAAPDAVALDPDYHVFRKVPPEYIIPTTARTRSGKALASVVGSGDLPAAYEKIRDNFESSFKEEARVRLVAGSIAAGALADRSVLILGSAVHDVYVSNFLSAIEVPVAFGDAGFIFDGVEYAEPGHAVLLTVHHPDVPGGGITVVYANSDSAVPNAISIPFYDRSMVIFKDRQPIVRHDFERPQITAVQVK